MNGTQMNRIHQKLHKFMLLRYIIACCLVFLAIITLACSDTDQRSKDSQLQKKPIESPQKSNELTLIMGGDALLHSQVYKDAQYSLSAQDAMNQNRQVKDLQTTDIKAKSHATIDSQKPNQAPSQPKSNQTANLQTDSQKQNLGHTPNNIDSQKITAKSHTKTDSQTTNAMPTQPTQSKHFTQLGQPKQAATIGYDFTKMFVEIAPFIKQYDLAFYNQETILGGTELGLSGYPTFNSPQEFGDCMISLGFNLISLANNHTLDRGIKAIENSYRYWQDKPVLTAGSYTSLEQRNTPQIRQKNGITYTMLAYTYGTNGIPIPKGKEYLVNVYTEQMLAEDIARVRDKVDLLIVSMHWGDEYVFTPTKEQERFARYLAGLGVDIVIGNHPHVIQPIERIGKTLVLYSLGNMISAQNGIERRVGMFAGVQVKKDSKSGAISLHDVHANLIYTYSDSKRRNFALYPFALLNESLLPNYKQIYQEYSQIITKRDSQIRVLPLESLPKNTEK